jgi:hypothetical protein
MHAKPQQEHEWLHQLIGDWVFEGECVAGPDQPPSKSTGTESVRSLGGLWVLCEGQGEMPGGGMASTIITLGYDPRRLRFVGTFIGSMFTHLWLYEGTLDRAGKVLTLDTEGPSFTVEGQLARYQDIFEIHDKDHRTLSSRVLGDDGTWTHFMTAHYRRKK